MALAAAHGVRAGMASLAISSSAAVASNASGGVGPAPGTATATTPRCCASLGNAFRGVALGSSGCERKEKRAVRRCIIRCQAAVAAERNGAATSQTQEVGKAEDKEQNFYGRQYFPLAAVVGQVSFPQRRTVQEVNVVEERIGMKMGMGMMGTALSKLVPVQIVQQRHKSKL